MDWMAKIRDINARCIQMERAIVWARVANAPGCPVSP